MGCRRALRLPMELTDLPQEALRRVTAGLRAAELAAAAAAASRTLRKVCRCPELWQRDFRQRFPDTPVSASVGWRDSFAAAIREASEKERASLLRSHRRLSERQHEELRCAQQRTTERTVVQAEIRRLRDELQEAKRADNELHPWGPDGAAIPLRHRAAAARRAGEIKEIVETIARLEDRLAAVEDARPAEDFAEPLRALGRKLQDCERRLALLPKPAKGAARPAGPVSRAAAAAAAGLRAAEAMARRTGLRARTDADAAPAADRSAVLGRSPKRRRIGTA